MNQNRAIIALDVGTKRIGVAVSDGVVNIARPLTVVMADGKEMDRILELISSEQAATIVVGYPRNQSGESTAQTRLVEGFKERLEKLIDMNIEFQDESLTSVIAEDRLMSAGRSYGKGDIDAEAATVILQDYLEHNYGRI